MLRKSVLLLAALAANILADPVIPRTANTVCPQECKCSSYQANCRSLELAQFNNPSLTELKLIDPSEPLKLSHEFFKNLGLQNLTRIVISNATVVELEETTFEGMNSLKSISIEYSVMPHLPANIFVNLPRLTSIDLTDTTLHGFENLKSDSVTELVLVNGNLTEITKDTFNGFKNLVFINLSGNKIGRIEDNAFQSTIALEEIDLSNNKLTSLPASLFDNHYEMTILNLSHNLLKNVTFSSNVLLEKLTLDSCKLENFQIDISTLSYLDLSDNNIEHLNEDAFSAMRDLQYLYLSNNAISHITKSAFSHNDRLLTLLLDKNPIVKLPILESFDGSQFSISNFSCSHCSIKELDRNVFENMKSVQLLDLSSNNIKQITDKVFSQLSNLQVLHLSRNSISDLHLNAFAGNGELRDLYLSENKIKKLNPAMFKSNHQLMSLDLSYGDLKQLWVTPTDVQLDSITVLNLKSNPLRQLTLAELKVTKNLELLDIDNVKVPCPQIKKLLPYLQRNKIGPTIYNTHEELNDAQNEYDDEQYKSWDEYDKKKCNDYSDTDDDDEELEEDDDNYEYDNGVFDKEAASIYNDMDYNVVKPEQPVTEDQWSDDMDDEEAIAVDADLVRVFEHSRFEPEPYSRFTLLWPTLVFILTSLLVLMVAVNVILLVMRRRGSLSRNVPQITAWGSSNRLLKKHCGSIYRPLSEELTDSKTPIISRAGMFVHDTPTVHNV